MRGDFCNQTQLARRLGVTTRRVLDLEQEGVIVRTERGRYDARQAEQAYRWFKDRDLDAISAEVESLSRELQDGMDELSAIEDIGERRKRAKTVGPQIAELGRLLTLATCLSPAGARREFERGWTGMVMARAIGDLLAACHFKIAEENRP